MFIFLLILMITVAFMYAAIRIILGWIVPARAIAAFERGVGLVAITGLKIIVLAFAAGILGIIWLAVAASST